MYSGSKIRDNTAYDGAGVFNKYGTFNMYGGEISWNSASGHGGGIYSGAGSVLNIDPKSRVRYNTPDQIYKNP